MAHEEIFLFSVTTNDGTTGGQYSLYVSPCSYTVYDRYVRVEGKGYTMKCEMFKLKT